MLTTDTACVRIRARAFVRPSSAPGEFQFRKNAPKLSRQTSSRFGGMRCSLGTLTASRGMRSPGNRPSDHLNRAAGCSPGAHPQGRSARGATLALSRSRLECSALAIGPPTTWTARLGASLAHNRRVARHDVLPWHSHPLRTPTRSKISARRRWTPRSPGAPLAHRVTRVRPWHRACRSSDERHACALGTQRVMVWGAPLCSIHALARFTARAITFASAVLPTARGSTRLLNPRPRPERRTGQRPCDRPSCTWHGEQPPCFNPASRSSGE